MLIFLLGCPAPDSVDSKTPDTSPHTADTGACLPPDTAEPAMCDAAVRSEYLQACLWDYFDDDLALHGHFTAFGPDGVVFLADDGTDYTFSGGTEGVWAELPDLTTAGDVDLLLVGNCGGYGEGTAAFLVSAPDGALLLLAGRGPGPWVIGEWEATRTDAGCGEREPDTTNCSACIEPQPVTVTGPESLEAWPGNPVESASYRLSVGLSYHGRNYICTDGPGNDLAFWYVVPRS